MQALFFLENFGLFPETTTRAKFCVFDSYDTNSFTRKYRFIRSFTTNGRHTWCVPPNADERPMAIRILWKIKLITAPSRQMTRKKQKKKNRSHPVLRPAFSFILRSSSRNVENRSELGKRKRTRTGGGTCSGTRLFIAPRAPPRALYVFILVYYHCVNCERVTAYRVYTHTDTHTTAAFSCAQTQ